MIESFAPAPDPVVRLIPSQYPPIGLFDTVSTAADVAAAMELAGWTNDRLVADRIRRLPRAQWVYGRPNASIVMASFLHVAPGGMRFSGPDLGAWYASASMITAAAEVGHHMRREAAVRAEASMSRYFRAYNATPLGNFLDLRGRQGEVSEVYASESYAAGQALGERMRAGGKAGIVYDSLRHAGGTNVVTYQPRQVTAVVQADHYEISIEVASRRMTVRRLAA